MQGVFLEHFLFVCDNHDKTHFFFFCSSNDLILLYFGPLLDFKTIHIFAYSSTWEQANKRSAGARPKADSFFGHVSLMRLGHLSLWHHSLKRFWSLVFYQKVSLKGGEFWLRFFFKQNYGHACPTKFTVFSSAVLLHKFTILCCGIRIILNETQQEFPGKL